MAQTSDGGAIGRLSLAAPAPGGSGITATPADQAAGARRLDEAGFDYTGTGDSVMGDTYAQLAVIAQGTSRISLLPTATNPATRHPMITASAIATVDEISGGRTYLGIGTGDSGVKFTGLPEPTWAMVRRAIVIVSSAHRRARDFEPWPDGIEIDETVVRLAWVRRRVPILVCAGGPKGGRVAAEMGDGILLRAGDVGWNDFPQRLAQLHEWRAQGPRAGDPFEVQINLPSYVTDSVEEGRARLGPVIAAMAHAALRESRMPPDLVEPWRRFHAEYDYAHHVSTVNPVNVDLMRELGLADYFFELFSFIGSEDALVDRLTELAALGFTAVTLGGAVFERAVAETQFDRMTDVRAKYLARIGPDAEPAGVLAGAPSEAVAARFRGPRA